MPICGTQIFSFEEDLLYAIGIWSRMHMLCVGHVMGATATPPHIAHCTITTETHNDIVAFISIQIIGIVYKYKVNQPNTLKPSYR
mgnify:CR=1 FL=1